MGRALKIIAYAVILFLLYLVIAGFIKSCKQKSADDITFTEETEPSFEDSDIFEEISDTEPSDSEGEDIVEEESVSEGIDYDKIDAVLEERENPEPEFVEATEEEVTPVYEAPTYADSSDGNFMIIAGSYLMKTNAENMVVKLKNLGYQKAEIVVFDQSQYHTVLASRSDDYDAALSLSRELTNQGIDSYVHRKN